MSWSRGIVAALVLALACGKDKSAQPARGEKEAVSVNLSQGGRPVASDASVGEARRAGALSRGAAPTALAARVDNAGETPSAELASPTPDAADITMIIRTGTATIKVDSLGPAVARLRALATSLGGYVGNTSIQTGADQLRSATVEIKVPASRWPLLLAGIKPIGTLEAQNESAEDVGEEFVDVQARVANSRRLEERLIALLANRTGKLQDALQVERELARVREEIDRYEGRIRYLRSRTSISTMMVMLHEPAPVLGTRPGDSPIADAFRDAWRGFVGLVAFAIASLGVVVPLGVVGWVAWWVVRKRRKA